IGPYPRRHEHDPASRGDSLQRVQLRRGFRGGFAAHLAGARDTGRQETCGVEDLLGIEVRDVFKKFANFEALKGVSLTADDGELVALLGPSGSGKTTLLRIIAGLDYPDSGAILLNGEDASTRSASARNVGFVFQHYALFRHMTVFENVAFGLRVRPKETR